MSRDLHLRRVSSGSHRLYGTAEIANHAGVTMAMRALYLMLPVGCLVTACLGAEPASGPSATTDSARRDADDRDDHDGHDGRDGIHKVKHVIIVMQENHSFDNYVGARTYAPGSPYHGPDRQHRDDRNGRDGDRDDGDRDDRGCEPGDHRCVDGL